jgi:hypothetical protein
MASIERVPAVAGEWRQIIHFDHLKSPEMPCGSVVDHCFFKASTGRWQAWVQVRDTPQGRVFTRWEFDGDAEPFGGASWTPHGICWRADHTAGESVGTRPEADVIQAPYVLHEGDCYRLVYGGGPVDEADEHRQVCLAESSDGIHFNRRLDADGLSRMVVGPRHAADAFLLRHGGEYWLYIGCSFYSAKGAQAAVTLRRSTDLLHWSSPQVVHAGGVCGRHTHSSQSAFVVFLDGYFYLFVMGWSNELRTAVYRSSDPEDFGREDDLLVAVLPASATEIIRDGDRWFLSSLVIPGYSGVRVAPLEWV